LHRACFSPDGRTLAVTAVDGALELWHLPIRKPIGKILALARMRLKANVVPNSVPAAK
jgi:hypothetical protein